MPVQEEAEKIKEPANGQGLGHTIKRSRYTTVPQMMSRRDGRMSPREGG